MAPKNIKIGSSNVDIKIGETQVVKVYMGETPIWVREPITNVTLTFTVISDYFGTAKKYYNITLYNSDGTVVDNKSGTMSGSSTDISFNISPNVKYLLKGYHKGSSSSSGKTFSSFIINSQSLNRGSTVSTAATNINIQTEMVNGRCSPLNSDDYYNAFELLA